MKPSDKVAAKLLKDMAKNLSAVRAFCAVRFDIEATGDISKLLARYERWKKSIKLP